MELDIQRNLLVLNSIWS